ncbi:MAG: hypothetical protein ABI461_20430, partial [Polyangiaceae bacterium]
GAGSTISVPPPRPGVSPLATSKPPSRGPDAPSKAPSLPPSQSTAQADMQPATQDVARSAPQPLPQQEEEEAAPPTLLEDPMTVEVAAVTDAPVEEQRLSQTAESPAAPADLRQSSESGDSPDAEPEIEAREILVKPKFGGPMVAITMLDGTTLQLPARKKKRQENTGDDASPPSEVGGLTARDLIAALRAESQGRDAGAVLGDDGKWEKVFAALLSLMLRKGLIADWEFIEELRKM